MRANFPVMNGGDGIILSKRGDIAVGWELTLPAAFRCNEEKYDSLVATLRGAITLLPDYTVVHKQDVFMRKAYRADPSATLRVTGGGRRVTGGGFLQEAYERHFDGREYLDHRCRLWLCFSSKKNVRGAPSGLMGAGTGAGMPRREEILRDLAAAEQFAAMVGGNGLWALRRLTEEDVFGETPDQVGGDGRVGILQDYLNFTDGGEDVLGDIALSPEAMTVGGKRLGCCLLADLDQLPGEVGSCRRVPELSTENSDVVLSFFSEIGQGLDCEHVVNWFCVKEPLKDIHGSLDTKRRQMQSMSARNAGNRKYAEEINDYLEKAATEQMYTVRCHVNVIYSGAQESVLGAITRMGVVPVVDRYDMPVQFWSSIPGNEAGLAFGEYMTMELSSALCLGVYEGFDEGIPGGVLKMSDRQRLTPQRFDIQEKAMELGYIENYNVFLLGPSGAGKSFFMNKYLKSCYDALQHCFLIDQGDSYRALCHIIKEESGGKDGTYYTFEKGKPISFNPFRNVGRFSEEDSEAMDFLFTLMATLWKNNSEPISSTAMTFLKQSVIEFLAWWQETLRQAQGDKEGAQGDIPDPVFDDYYGFLDKVFRKTLMDAEIRPEHFDFEGYMIALGQFVTGGAYGYLLNSRESIDILNDRFVVFEIDHIKGDKVIYPITTLVIMDAFGEKMRSSSDFKVMVIEEAWKAIMGTQMATYMMELWKTARKHRTSAVVVTQELKDIISSPIIKDTIVENSGVKILLDQTKYVNRFEELAGQLSLSEDDKSMVLSLNRYRPFAGAQGDKRGAQGDKGPSGREVFFNLGNKKSFVMRLEVSPEERWAFSSAKKDKLRLAAAVEKSGGSYIKAIKSLVKKDASTSLSMTKEGKV